MKLKKYLRRFIPASRTYVDTKFNNLEKDLIQQSNSEKELIISQTKELEEKLKVLFTEPGNNYHATTQKYIDSLKRHISFEHNKSQINVQNYINQELKRRDDWMLRASENKRIAAGRPIWIIKCPAPEDVTRERWGDYPFALALKKYLERLNCYVVIDTREDWGCEEGADVVLVLRGCNFYRPDRRNKKTIYIMWNISHPDMISTAEYNLYDIVCVASNHFAKELKLQVKVPVIPLLQCTDTEEFYPDKNNTEKKWNYILSEILEV